MTNGPLSGDHRHDDAALGSPSEGDIVGAVDVPRGEGPPVGGHPPIGEPRRRRLGPAGSDLRRRLRRATAVVAALACLTALAVAWVGARALQASEHLRTAGTLIHRLQGQVERGDVQGAQATLASLQRETGAARAETADPAWRIGGRMPGVGSDLAAVRAVAVAVDDLVRQGLPHIVDAAAAVDLGTLAPKDGRMDLSAVQNAAPRIAIAAAAVQRARDQVAVIDTRDLLPQTAAGVKELSDGLQRAARTIDTAGRVSALLPSMLGADSPRTYLVMFQNPAELRATGGLPGAFLAVQISQGAVQVIDQGSLTTLGRFQGPVLPLDPAMRALYTDRIGEFPGDVNVTPDFPTAAALYREMYRRRTGRTVDGVLATDPVALSYLLKAAGSVPLPNGAMLTADNAVRTLLSDVYAEFSFAAQDQFFAAAARGVFDALMRQPQDMAGMVAQVARAVGERRVLMWSADPQEEQRIAGTMLEGLLPITDRTTPTVGVFLNDATGGKMSYYLTQAADLSPVGCRADGTMELKLRVTLGSTAPSSRLPKDVTGLAAAGPGNVARTNVSIFSPTGGTVMDARLDGRQAPLLTGTERRRSVAIVTVDLKPGETRTIEVTMLTGIPPAGAGPTLRPRLWTTPGVTPWALNVHSEDFCHPER